MRQTDRHTHTHRPSTVTLTAHVRRGLITTQMIRIQLWAHQHSGNRVQVWVVFSTMAPRLALLMHRLLECTVMGSCLHQKVCRKWHTRHVVIAEQFTQPLKLRPLCFVLNQRLSIYSVYMVDHHQGMPVCIAIPYFPIRTHILRLSFADLYLHRSLCRSLMDMYRSTQGLRGCTHGRLQAGGNNTRVSCLQEHLDTSA